jgi:hypothetical protein
VHHWLSRLESEISTAHGGLTKLSTDITDMRLAVARLEGRAGSLSSGTARWLAGLTIAAVAQVGAALYWGGEVRTLLEATAENASHSLSLIEEHQRKCSERVSTLELKAQKNELRIETIEKRNLIADKNWEIVRNRGLLVDQTK